MTDRKTDLLQKAAEAFDDGSDPFCTDWLVENHVTADECMDLSSNIGVIIHGYLAAPSDLRNRINLLGAATAAGLPADVLDGADASLRMQQLTRELHKNAAK